MRRGTTWLIAIIIVLVCGAIWDAGKWVLTGGHPNRRATSEIVSEASTELLKSEAAIRRLTVTGMLHRERLDPATHQWLPAGQITATCVYEYGPAGRARADCSDDLPDAPSIAPAHRFTAIYDGNSGITLLADATPPRVVLESARPALLERADEATGWRYALFGRWIGGGENGAIFSDVLDNPDPTTHITAEDVDPEMTPSLLLALHRPDATHLYWIDINNNYALWKWEQHAPDTPKSPGPLQRSARITTFWYPAPQISYPRHIDITDYAPDGAAIQRDHIDITNVTMDSTVGRDDLSALAIPAGQVILQSDRAAPRILTGTAAENTQAILAARPVPTTRPAHPP